MKKGIIDFLYTEKECSTIRDLYSDDKLKPLIQKSIGDKILSSKDAFINGNALDILSMICLNQNFTEDTSECFAVAVFVQRGLTNISNTLPLMSESSGLDLASKTLVALSFFKPAIIKRWQKHGAPTPAWYRRTSQAEFIKCNLHKIACHHMQWENFLSEYLI